MPAARHLPLLGIPAPVLSRTEALADLRPLRRGDCLPGGMAYQRPCPHTTWCRHHMWPELAPDDELLGLLGDTCALDWIDARALEDRDATDKDVADALGLEVEEVSDQLQELYDREDIQDALSELVDEDEAGMDRAEVEAIVELAYQEGWEHAAEHFKLDPSLVRRLLHRYRTEPTRIAHNEELPDMEPPVDASIAVEVIEIDKSKPDEGVKLWQAQEEQRRKVTRIREGLERRRAQVERERAAAQSTAEPAAESERHEGVCTLDDSTTGTPEKRNAPGSNRGVSNNQETS